MQKNKKVLIALILIFVAPLLGAYFLFLNHHRFHFKTTNHGEFVKPPILIEEIKTAEKKPLWQMIYVMNQDCDDLCLQNLYKMRQIRIALNQDQEKARGVVLKQTDQSLLRLDQYLRKDYAMIDLVTKRKSAPLQNNHFYLADPKGYIILIYKPDANPKDILKDLKHLIKVNNP